MLKISGGSKFICYPYGVEGLENISHGFYVYSTTNLTPSVRARTRFIQKNGLSMSTIEHSFSVVKGMPTWQKIEAVEVPSGAVKAELELTNSSGTVWFGLIKSEAGTVATDYTENRAGQMSKITASGVYTGTITANQIVLSNETLADRLVTINSSVLSLSQNLNKASDDIKNTDIKLTKIRAGEITINSKSRGTLAGMSLLSDQLLFKTNSSHLRIMAGGNYDFIQAGHDNKNYFRLTNKGKIYATGAEIDGTIKATGGTIGGFTIKDVLESENDKRRLQVGASGSGYFLLAKNKINNNIFSVDWDGTVNCTNLTAKGTIQAGSIINGTLNNTSGTHSGAHYGYHSGYHSGQHSGRHDGDHYGYVDSSSGYLGYSSYSNRSNGVWFKNNVGCSNNMSTQSLRISGSGSYGGTWTHWSDARLKEDIHWADKNLVKDIYKLKIKEFSFKKSKIKSIGVIAQDLIKYCSPKLSSLCVINNDNELNVDYVRLSTIALLAIQNLNERVKELENVKHRNM